MRRRRYLSRNLLAWMMVLAVVTAVLAPITGVTPTASAAIPAIDLSVPDQPTLPDSNQGPARSNAPMGPALAPGTQKPGSRIAETAPAGPALPTDAIERLDLRTRNGKIFMRPDGSGIALAYTTPVHYQTPDGSWEEIDNRLIADPDTGYGWRNASNDTIVRFAVTSPDVAVPPAIAQGPALLASAPLPGAPLVEIARAGYSISFLPLDAAAVQGQVEGNSIVYPEIYPGADLRYWIAADQFKEDLVFHQVPGSEHIAFLLEASGGTLVATNEGAITFAGCTRDCPSLAPPFLEDAAGVTSTDITVNLAPQGPDRYLLTYSLDSAWLSAPERVYPVVLDPTTQTLATGSSMYLQQGAPTTATCNAQQNVYIGYDPPASFNKQSTRGFFYFDLPALPPGASITNAQFFAYQYYTPPGAGGYNTNVYRPTVNWHDGSVCANAVNVWTWLNQPAVDTGTVWTTGFVDTAAGWKGWDITGLTQQWATGTQVNHGLAIYSNPENQIGSAFCSAVAAGNQCGQPANAEALRPYAQITFTGPALTAGLTLTPSAQALNADVAATFTLRNDGPAPATLDLRVSVPGAGDFPTVTGVTIPAGGTYDYAQTRQFTTLGSFQACAQYLSGATWLDLPVDGGVACATLNILDTAPVQLDSPLTLTPNQFEPGGGTSEARFVVRNTGAGTVTERFRARVTSGGVTFDETVDVTLAPNATYTYVSSKTFSQAGVYEVIAEHRVGTAWLPLLGQGSGFIRVKAGPPPPILALKGTPTTVAYCGEPVNSATGNYVSDFTDLSDPTPGIPLAVTRWYNAIDAGSAPGPFGFGTSWAYGMAVTWRTDKSATVSLADGQVAYFLGIIDPANPGDVSGVYESQGKDRGTLVRAADGTAVLTMPDQTAYSFNAAGQLAQISHPYPAAIDIVLAGGRPVQIIHSAGVTYDITYTGDLITRIDSSSGRAVTYAYSPAGDLVQVTLPDGATYRYSYDANHRLTEARDPNNNAFVRNTFDAQGRVIEQLDQTGKPSAIVYGAGGADRRTFTDALGNPITHVYDAELRVVEEIDSLGRSVKYVRDARGNVTQLTDRSGQVWRYTYDSRDNLLTETTPLGHTTTYTYDARNNRTSVRDPLGNTTTYTYDSADRLTQVTDPLGNTRTYAYDTRGNLIREQDEAGAPTWYGYNTLGLRTVITDSLQLVTRIEYDSLGNITRYTDAAGRVATSTYDDQSRLTRSTDPIGTIVDFTYDPMGNLLSQTDGMGNVRRYTYDAYDRLVEETDLRGNPTRYGYDTLGRRTRVTDALNFTTIYTYNQVGELVERQERDGTVVTFGYDANGWLVNETDQLGRVTSYIYDAAGRQIEVRRPCDACLGSVAISRTAYDAAGRVIEETDPRGAVTRYTHDALGRVATKTLPNSGVYSYTYDPTGRLIQKVDPLGGITRYTYDALGRVITVTDPLGRVTTNVYDPVGNLVEVTDPRGNKTTYVLDANDRQIRRTDALGNLTQMTYDAQGRMTAETDALGQITRMVYDPNGNQISVTDRTGAATLSEYDALNRLVKRTDALGGVFTTTYDAMGRVVGTSDALGGTTATSYDASGRRIAERDVLSFTRTFAYDRADNLIEQREPTGATTRYAYDAGGLQVGMTNALGFTRVYTYDIASNLTDEQNERGFVTRYEYDLFNRRTAQIDPLGNRQTTGYDAAGQIASSTDYNGNTTTYEYDAAGNQVKVTDALGGVSSTEYDALNRAIAMTDALGRVTRMEYDALGRTVKTTSPAGNVTTYGFDAEGRQIEVINALGQTTRTAYDGLGRPVKLTDALGRETLSAYDALGRLTARTDALSRVTRYSYDGAGRPLSVTAPGDVTQRYTYDSVSNVLSERDGRGVSVSYTYDLLNRITAMVYGANSVYLPFVTSGGTVSTSPPVVPGPISSVGRRVWSYGYDAAGNQVSVNTPAERRITMAYDALDRLTEKRYGGNVFASYTYDANGNRVGMRDSRGETSYTYDALNRLTASTDPAGRTAINTFDAVGQRTRLIYPDGSVASYAYNPDGALSQITALDGGVTRYTLDALNRPTRVAQANGVVVEQRYDVVGNLLEMSERGPGGLIARHDYTLDQVNRRVRQVAELPQGSVTTDYTYDNLDRLVLSKSSDGSEARYTFDASGNRTSEAGVRVAAGVAPEAYQATFRYSLANELLSVTDSVLGTTNYSYNADGQRTGYEGRGERARYSYDAEGRMVEARVEDRVGAQWLLRDDMFQRYAYDGDGRRVLVDTFPATGGSLSVRQEARYDDFTGWDVLQSYDSVASPSGVRYLYDQPLHKLAYGADSMGYFINDGLGSVLGATNDSGALSSDAGLMRYGDYGQQVGRVAALPTTDGYTGYELDGYTGLNYARNRYYDAGNGTFLTPDPFPADRRDMLGLHRYLYTQANPINNTDPLGLFNMSAIISLSSQIAKIIKQTIVPTREYSKQVHEQVSVGFVDFDISSTPLKGTSAYSYVVQQVRRSTEQGMSGSSCGKKTISLVTLSNTNYILGGLGLDGVISLEESIEQHISLWSDNRRSHISSFVDNAVEAVRRFERAAGDNIREFNKYVGSGADLIAVVGSATNPPVAVTAGLAAIVVKLLGETLSENHNASVDDMVDKIFQERDEAYRVISQEYQDERNKYLTAKLAGFEAMQLYYNDIQTRLKTEYQAPPPANDLYAELLINYANIKGWNLTGSDWNERNMRAYWHSWELGWWVWMFTAQDLVDELNKSGYRRTIKLHDNCIAIGWCS